MHFTNNFTGSSWVLALRCFSLQSFFICVKDSSYFVKRALNTSAMFVIVDLTEWKAFSLNRARLISTVCHLKTEPSQQIIYNNQCSSTHYQFLMFVMFVKALHWSASNHTPHTQYTCKQTDRLAEWLRGAHSSRVEADPPTQPLVTYKLAGGGAREQTQKSVCGRRGHGTRTSLILFPHN